MSGEHARVRELFLAAVELPISERAAYLRSSGADSVIVHQVENLLKHVSPETVMEPRRSRPVSQRLSVSRFLPALKFLAPIASTRGRQWTTAMALFAFLAVGGQSLRSRVRAVAEEHALSAVRAIEESNSNAFEDQLADWRAAVEAPVSPSLGRQAIIAAIRNPTPANLARFDQYASNLLTPGRFRFYYLTDANGIVRGIRDQKTPNPSPATPVGMETYSRAFVSGTTVVEIPGMGRATTPVRRTEKLGPPAFLFYVPILEDGNRVGLFVVERPIEPLYARLRKTRIFGTGESYIFSPDGVILSPVRFEAEMLKWGLATNPEAAAVLPRIYLRDPGRRLAESSVASGEQPATWPPTLLVRTVSAARDAGNPDGHNGTIATPYRDYRGELVVSAWRWIPDLGIGYATEVDASEVLAASQMLDRALLALLLFLAMGGIWTILSSGWLLRLVSEVDKRRQMGSYSLIEKIGEGGMGEVFLARHSLLKRTAALKLLRRDRLDDASNSQFENEVKTASHLRHPNTVGIFDFGRASDGTFYCAMEYLPGLSLAEWIRRSGRMPAERTIHIVHQICSALTEAHGEGLLHCDVKPSNVMLCSMGGLHDFVKLLDFGLATPLHKANEANPLNTSGTPYYTAPERLRADGLIDGRSDIYSLGVLWYYLLTARLPHSAGVHWVEATLSLEMAPISSHFAVDAEIVELIGSCIARNMEERPVSTLAMLDRLEGLARRLPWTEREARDAWKE